MKDEFIFLSALIVGLALIYLVIAILPFLIALMCIGLICWTIIKFLVGNFSPWPPQRK